MSTAGTVAGVATAAATAVGAGLGVVGKIWLEKLLERRLDPIQRQTEQLEHNGGSHVADYARDARDSSLRTEAVLNQHLIDSAATHARHDTLIQLLLDERKH